jgi:hypothetical protein
MLALAALPLLLGIESAEAQISCSLNSGGSGATAASAFSCGDIALDQSVAGKTAAHVARRLRPLSRVIVQRR